MQIPHDRLLDQLAQLDRRYTDLERQVVDQAASRSDPHTYQALSKELSSLRAAVTGYRTYLRIRRAMDKAARLRTSTVHAGLATLVWRAVA